MGWILAISEYVWCTYTLDSTQKIDGTPEDAPEDHAHWHKPLASDFYANKSFLHETGASGALSSIRWIWSNKWDLDICSIVSLRDAIATSWASKFLLKDTLGLFWRLHLTPYIHRHRLWSHALRSPKRKPLQNLPLKSKWIEAWQFAGNGTNSVMALLLTNSPRMLSGMQHLSCSILKFGDSIPTYRAGPTSLVRQGSTLWYWDERSDIHMY